MKKGGRLRAHARTIVQISTAVAANANFSGFVSGTIFTGGSKSVCAPGLNCYSCPGALLSCPLGAVQTGLASRKSIPMVALGFILVFGAALGRFICGWLCPFGLVQELIHKIPFFRKPKTLPGERWLRGIKYALLVGLVFLYPLFGPSVYGVGSPGFCEFVCPAGTFGAGIPMMLANEAMRPLAGALFWIKIAILAAIILLALAVWRPFCRYLCPLGAMYGLLQKVSLYRFRVTSACVGCGKCRDACPMAIDPVRTPNSAECVRCGKCRRACPTGAIETSFAGLRRGARGRNRGDAS